MNHQRARIERNDRARVHNMSDRQYLGRAPEYMAKICEKTGMVLGYIKIKAGIPFIKTKEV